MIEYITEKEYERRFDRWKRARVVPNEALTPCLETELEANAVFLAKLMVEDHSWSASEVRECFKRQYESAMFRALRYQFEKRFLAGATGPDKNAIPFCGDWKNDKDWLNEKGVQ